MTAEHRVLVESLVALGLMVVLTLMWIFPQERAALSFSEEEVAFLFPAPIGRRTLINYKLLKSQLAILLSALFMTILRPWAGGNFLCRAVGWWGVLSVVNLHLIGSSFARTMLLDRGISNWQRRALFFGVLGLGVLGVGMWARESLPPPPSLAGGSDLAAWGHYGSQLVAAGPVPWILLPFRWVVGPMFARGVGEFAWALAPLVLIIALHYLWVIWSNVAFEEASVEQSRKLAERLAAMREGNWQAATKPKKGRQPPFALGPVGWPGAAIFWKNLIGAGYFFTKRSWIWLAWVVIVAGVAMRNAAAHSGVGVMVAFGALMLVFMSLVSGPQILRHDFRQDLRVADMLKMYPMASWQVVLGEVLAPAAIMAGAQWLLLMVAAVFFNRLPNGTEVAVSVRVDFGLAAALVLPLVDFIALLLPNAAALIFPAWVQLGKNSPRGMETMGQQIILMAGQVLVLALTLLPAALVFAVGYFVGNYFLGMAVAVVLGALWATVVLGAEAALGVVLLGKAFRRFDWSEGVGE
jgi:hypothetical protein